MTSAEWHVGPDLLRRYAAATVDDVGRAAIETHVTSCQSCRDEASSLVPPEELAPVWEAISITVAAPRPSRPARWVRRLGVRDSDLTVLRASTSIAVPFTLALVAALTFALAGTALGTTAQLTFYLALAPLLPAIMIAAAYDATDPIRELCTATPFPQLRVALVRTITATGMALPLMVLMALVPNIGLGLGAWLLPSLTLATVTLTLLSWLRAVAAITVVATGWLVVVAVLRTTETLRLTGDPGAQTTFVGVALVAATILASRLGPLTRKDHAS